MTDAVVAIRRRRQNDGVFDGSGGGGDRCVPELPAAEEPRHRDGGLVGPEGQDHRSG